MSDNKLESFKVGDKHRPRVKPSSTATGSVTETQAAQDPVRSTGFERIETLLDQEMPGDVNRRLVALIDQLDSIMADARSAKDKATPRRAKIAVERTMDLVAYLFDTKSAMAQSLGIGALAPSGDDPKQSKAKKGSK